MPHGAPLDSYSTGKIYKEIKVHQQQVSWHRVVWFSKGISRHNFLAWLTVLNRCATKDRIMQWGLQTNPTCVLCNNAAETREHLYFDCTYSWMLWSNLAGKAHWSPSRIWQAELQHLQSSSMPKSGRLLAQLAWQAAIYLLRTERNSRIYRQQFRSVQSLLRQADHLIRNRISSFREENPALSSQMLQLWFDR